MPRRTGVRRAGPTITFLLGFGLLLGGVLTGPVAAATYPPLPLALDRGFLNNVSGAELAPGGSGTLTLRVANPLPAAMTGTILGVGVYAFNAFPGNATSGVGVASPPVLSNQSASGLDVNVSLGTLLPGGSQSVSISVQSAATTPAGTFAVRTSLRFSENGTAYELASRGWFTAAAWSFATSGPGGSTDVNLTALGVSGLTPETSILVQSNSLPIVLGAVLGVGLVVLAVGAGLYYRRSNSRSGTRPVESATHAPRAFGSSRTNDGD